MSLFNFSGRKTFSRGVHPDANKSTAGTPIRRMPFASRMILPLAQHIGKPAVPLVRAGEEVVRGQPIAKADGFLSVPLHAPADGVIESIELKPSARGPWVESIVLRVYEASTQEVRWASPRDLDAMQPAEIIQAIQDSGMVGLGGAAFPSHAKLKVPAETKIHTLVVNGCECEPYLTCDHKMMLEFADDLMIGTHLAMKAVGAQKAIIGIEDNKLDAVAAIQATLDKSGIKDITVQAVETKYPQGAEKMLIKSLTGIEVPAGGLPMHVGMVVNNVGTLALLGSLIPQGRGLTERVVTVTGPGIKKPGDYWVPIGTPMRTVLEWAGAADADEREIILGGPMMGQAVASLDVPVTKGVSGILVFDKFRIESDARVWPCIKCSECVKACPMGLNPSMLGMLATSREYDLMGSEYHLGDCFECGCCTYVCPSHIPLVQQFRVAKGVLRGKAT